MNMRRTFLAPLLAILAAAIIVEPRPAFPAAMTAWARLDTSQPGTKSISASCAAGTSCDAPTGGAAGLNLYRVQWVSVQVCADDGRTISDGDGIQFYLYDTSGQWGAVNVTTYAVKTGGRCAWVLGDSPTLALPMPGRGWLQAIPTNMATDQASALTVYIFVVDAAGNAL
jgi:hypothetical protein